MHRNQISRSIPWFFAAAASLALGCTSHDDVIRGGSVETGDASSAGGSGGAIGAEAGATCSGPGFAGSPAQVPFEHLSATVQDLDDNPVPDVPAQACGVNVCLNGTTDTAGHVLIDVSQSITKP